MNLQQIYAHTKDFNKSMAIAWNEEMRRVYKPFVGRRNKKYKLYWNLAPAQSRIPRLP